MKMILHGIPNADPQDGDTLAEPMHREGGELARFDRVVTDRAFSQNYTEKGIQFPERFAYGFCPEPGKKADLTFLQHMLAALRPGGLVCTVMPHAVRFRGGAEKGIREGFIEDELLGTAIGLGPQSGAAGCSLSMPTASTSRAGRGTYCCRSTSRTSSASARDARPRDRAQRAASAAATS